MYRRREERKDMRVEEGEGEAEVEKGKKGWRMRRKGRHCNS